MNTEDRLGLLVELLFDESESDLAARDDAAIDLGDFDEADAETALLRFGSDGKRHPMLLASVGESLGFIWARKGLDSTDKLQSLVPVVRQEALGVLGRISEMAEQYPDTSQT